jgi:hypothetical protein
LAVKQIREAMRDPDSFQLSKALVMLDGSGCIDYRSRNGFGGMNAGRAVVAPDGRIRIEEQGDAFLALWNKECSGKPGRDLTDMVTIAAGLNEASGNPKH